MKKIKLFLAAVAAMVTMGVNAQTWTGSEPAAGTYFLYNVGAGKFLNVGDRSGWGTNAWLTAEYGLDLIFTASGTGYTLDTQVSNGGSNHFLNHSMWCDGSADAWVFTKTERNDINTYTISYTDNGSTNYIVATADGTDVAYTSLSNTERDQWQIIGRSDILANLQANTASSINRTVATFFISDPDFGRNDLRMSPGNFVWTFTTNNNGETVIPGRETGYLGNGGTDVNGSYPNYGCQFWNNTFDIHQDLTNLPNGIYEFEIYGYGTNGTTSIYATTASGTTSKVFKNQTSAADFHTALNNIDNYGGNVTGLVQVTDGTLTIGVKRDNNSAADWTVIDQARLYYYGDYTFAECYGADLSVLITTAQGLVSAAPFAALATNLSSAITTARGVMSSGTTEQDFANGQSDLQSAIDAYNAQLTLIADYLTVRAAVITNRDDASIFTDANSAVTTLNSALSAQDAAAANAADNAAVTACITALRNAFSTFLGSVTVNDGKSFDITNIFITNSAPWASTDGWNCPVAATPNSTARAAEFWNKSGVSITQEMVSLPAGYYTLKAQAFARTGCAPIYIFAGAADTDSDDDNIQELIKKSNSEISTMEGAGSWFDGGDGWNTFTYQNETAGSFTIGLKDEFEPNGSHGDGNDGWLIWREFGLLYLGTEPVSVLAELYEDAKDAAEAARDNATYANVAGAERAALVAAIADTPEATAESYKAKTSALIVATNSFIDDGVVLAWNNYATAFGKEVEKATALGLTSGQINSCAATSATSAPSSSIITACIQNLMVAEYNYVATNYGYAVTLGTWNASEGTGTMTSQHWDGKDDSEYLEQSTDNFHSAEWEISYDQDIALPRGDYVFKVAGRTANSNDVTMSLTVKNGETVLGTVNDFPKGDTGLGINKAGATSFDAEDEEGFANNGNGRGWQWRYVKFTLAEPATVNVAVTASATIVNQWVGFCNATVQTDKADNVALMNALVALNNAKAAATLTQRTNVGTGVFQYNKTIDDALWSAYSTTKSNAESFVLTAESTAEGVTALTTDLTNAQDNYEANNVLVAPATDKRYVLTIVEDGKAWNGNAVTFIEGGRNDMGGYGVKYLTPANANMNQALKFTAVDGETNTYKVSAINVADGGERYITTGSTYDGGNNTQIRTTDDASKASWVKIQATATSGQFQLLNVSDGNKVIANNDNDDMYTANSCNFTISEASQASVTVTPKAGKYGTVIFPFTPDVSEGFDGITFYSIDDVYSSTKNVKIEEVAVPAANTPYLIKNENGDDFSKTLTGWGIAAATSYEDGLLTGVYTATTIEKDANNYVLQTQKNEKEEDVQAFYLVSGDEEYTFTATANKCYLTYDGAAGIKAFFLNFNDETGINTIDNGQLTMDNATIYNLAGQRVNKAQKGLYIVNGKKVLVK